MTETPPGAVQTPADESLAAVAPEVTAKLFEPTRIGSLDLDNRVVMPAMTRTMAPGGVPGAANAEYYRRRAEGGVGLIITEGTWVPHPAAANEADVPRMYGDDALAGWKLVTDAVHAENVPILAQLWHVGQMKQHVVEGLYDPSNADTAPPRRIGPSGLFGGIGHETTLEGEPATQADIDSVVEAYRQAGANAKAAGFDGIELHAAHGYMLDQFFWPGTNKRDDAYGGSLANRSRLAADIVRAIRAATGPDFAISLRISQWKVHDFAARNWDTPAEIEEFARIMTDAGVDVFHCSQRRFWETEFASDLNLAGWFKKLSGKPTISVGTVAMTSEHIDTLMGASSKTANIDRLLEVMNRGDFDMIAIGRGLLIDPDWARKVEAGRLDLLKPWDPQILKSLS